MAYGYIMLEPWDIGLLYFRQANIPAMHLSYDFARLVELGPPDTWTMVCQSHGGSHCIVNKWIIHENPHYRIIIFQ